jgi:hypothetical protein
MTDAPKHIWALADRRKHWQDEPPQDGQHDWHWTEYARKDELDAANARVAELEVALSKARDDALHEAANIANGYGSCACDPDMHAAILRLIEQPAR